MKPISPRYRSTRPSDSPSPPISPIQLDDRKIPNGLPSSSPFRSSLLTIALSSFIAVGVQFGWALQLSLLTPYIQTLGIGHAFTSFIWLCGPITGLVVQPCVGVWSDKCTLKLGRRRPFILAGSLLICLAVTIIGFSADVGYILGDNIEGCKASQGNRPRAAGIFIMGFWLLDLANNTVQGPARALLADLAGSEQRDTANAIFCLWMAVGNIIGFSAGASDKWHRIFPFVLTRACCNACGNLKAAFLVAVVILSLCTIVTVVFARETPLIPQSMQLEDASPLLDNQPEKSIELQSIRVSDEVDQLLNVDLNENAELSFGKEKFLTTNSGPGAVLVNLLTNVRMLPSEMKSVLIVMALCWLSWFPFFLFDTDWMGREVFNGDPFGDEKEAIAYDDGVHQGAFGLLLNSVVLAIGSFMIDPLCRHIGPKLVWSISNFIICVCMASTAVISVLAVHKSDLYTSWAKNAAIALFAVLGLPLAVTYSVPYSITAQLTSGSGGGQGLAMGVLNLAVVIPQMVVALGAGPWDALFGGGNEPAFSFAALFALAAGMVALWKLPQLSKGSYGSAAAVHGFG